MVQQLYDTFIATRAVGRIGDLKPLPFGRHALIGVKTILKNDNTEGVQVVFTALYSCVLRSWKIPSLPSSDIDYVYVYSPLCTAHTSYDRNSFGYLLLTKTSNIIESIRKAIIHPSFYSLSALLHSNVLLLGTVAVAARWCLCDDSGTVLEKLEFGDVF
ncbi:hypothetical protein BCR42DRAFT_494972 [Absidia repens]|uniref:Uncharacterized protein n=1 Tax=Absidia repens TaxID=90262 RepID=A0A1X2I580_9FUNG|nr:hypothetical protein BCR42DRAFT_494972 [Absidia repens]